MPERGDNAIYKIARASMALENFDFGNPPHALLNSTRIDPLGPNIFIEI
jgi:hypothetical protein